MRTGVSDALRKSANVEAFETLLEQVRVSTTRLCRASAYANLMPLADERSCRATRRYRTSKRAELRTSADERPARHKSGEIKAERSGMFKSIRKERGQGTVEAAIVIPVLFLLMLMLLQPGIILYDRIIMGSAAAEGCRLLATASDASGSYEAFIRHRLAAVPQHDCFHVHHGSCSWRIEMSGNESSEVVSVRICNELRPLPLFDAGAKLRHDERQRASGNRGVGRDANTAELGRLIAFG